MSGVLTQWHVGPLWENFQSAGVDLLTTGEWVKGGGEAGSFVDPIRDFSERWVGGGICKWSIPINQVGS